MAGPGTAFPGLYGPDGAELALPGGKKIRIKGTEDFNRAIIGGQGAEARADFIIERLKAAGETFADNYRDVLIREYEVSRAEKRNKAKSTVGAGVGFLLGGPAGAGVGQSIGASAGKEVPLPLLGSTSSSDASAIEAARARQRERDLRRRGRKATILTGSQGVEQGLGLVNRPQARASTLLGGTG